MKSFGISKENRHSVIQMTHSIRAWLLPMVVLFAAVTFILAVGILHHNYETKYHKVKSEAVARTLAEDLSDEISNRIKIFTVLGETKPSEKTLESFAQTLVDQFPDVFAVNLVSADGVIEKVFPEEPNILAAGQNLFKKPEVVPYLEESRRSGTPQLSHQLLTFQKIYAYVLYVPLYDDDKKFIGWLNAVVDFNRWLIRALDRRQLADTHILVEWDHPSSVAITHGPPAATNPYRFKFDIFNQKISFQIALAATHVDVVKRRLYQLVNVVAGLMILALCLLTFKMTKSEIKLTEANAQLNLKNTLLGSLTHDISTPLAILGINLREMLEHKDQDLTPKQRAQVARALTAIEEMLDGARAMHHRSSGLQDLVTHPISLEAAVKKALSLAEPGLAAKSLVLDIESPISLSLVKADEKTLVHNVLRNVFNNAIKFSPPKEKIRIHFKEEGPLVQLYVDDQGSGFTKAQLDSFRKYSLLMTSKGTLGEAGTGLGLLQIKSLMTSYGGDCVLTNNTDGGGRVVLTFKAAEKAHPLGTKT